MFYGYKIVTRSAYYIAEVCLLVILALDSNTGPRANVAIQWHYNLVAGVNHAHSTLETES